MRLLAFGSQKREEILRAPNEGAATVEHTIAVEQPVIILVDEGSVF